MPSPFPGMDPYLEGEMWQEFHETLAGEIRARLLPHLRPKYVALLAKRYVMDRPSLGIVEPPQERIVYPDVHVVEPAGLSSGAALATAPASVDVAEPTTVLPSPFIEEVPHMSVEIRDIAERRLVTVIEILSPVNKRSHGAQEYMERRLELMQTDTHILEIDLLSRGTRIQLGGEVPRAPYYAYLSRARRRPFTLVWAIQLTQALPTVPVPLLQPDPDVTLDLQAAVAGCFDLVGYEQLLDYSEQPPGHFEPEESAWIINQLSETGFR